MKLPIRLLFLCTGNSCRSIIAEALANHLGQGKLKAVSAGSFPTGKVNDNAIAVLQKHNIPLPELKSQSWDEFENYPLDVVITVCASAAGETCPVWMGDAVKAHWGVEDPAHINGEQAVIEAAFEITYREMHERISALLALDLEGLSLDQLRQSLADIQASFS
jgi:arsenate reductase